MADRADITPELCRQLLRYEPETGRLFWLPRPREMFKSNRSHSTFSSRFAGGQAFTNRLATGYFQGEILGVPFYAHRVAWAIFYGTWPTEYVDHINGLPGDNRIRNLRSATHAENLRNCKMDARNSSGVNGVFWCAIKQRWTAKIRHNGRYISLGYFRELEAAAEARRAADLKYGYWPGHGLPRTEGLS
jgi:hypothetical protein